MSQQKSLVRLLFLVLFVFLFLISKGVGNNPAKAVDCCIPSGASLGFTWEEWSCIIDGEQWDCEGPCTHIKYHYTCGPHPCNNDYEIPIFQITGPCISLDPVCDDGFAICIFTPYPMVYIECYQICI